MTRWSARGMRRRAALAVAAWFNPALWSQDDMIIAVAGVVLAVSVFFPWFQATVRFRTAPETGFLMNPPGTVSGLAAHQYLWVVPGLALLEIAVLAARYHPSGRALTLPLYRWFLIVASALICIIVLAGGAVKPRLWNGLRLEWPLYLTVGWSYGAIVALVTAVGSLVIAIVAIRR